MGSKVLSNPEKSQGSKIKILLACKKVDLKRHAL